MAQSFNTSLKNIAGHYIQLLQVKVNVKNAQRDIEENPYYPSLLSLSDTFSKYNISNNAFEVDYENFDQLEPPFVAFTKLPAVGRDFVLVLDMKADSISYLHKNRKVQTLGKREFLQGYQNIVWVAEADEQSGETGYAEKRNAERKQKTKKIAWYAALLALVMMTLAANINQANYWAFGSIAFLKFAGVATTIMLLIYETDKNNAFVKNICTAGRQTNCDSVLSSKAAKIGGISWGEIGFFYFAATTLWLLLPAISFVDKIAGIAVANSFVVPYILFSLYYQWKVVKQWCPLCLTVQAVLLLELLWSLANFWFSQHQLFVWLSGFAAPAQWLGAASCVLLPMVLWYGIKSILIKAKDADLYSSAYRRLQYNPDIFNGLLKQQQKAPEGWQQLGISIGNPKATATIIKVCNPYCGPCAKAHPKLEEIINTNSNVNVKIIFAVDNSEYNIAAVVVKHLLAVAAEGNAFKTQHSLDDWYLPDKKVYDLFAAKYQLNDELKQYDSEIDSMSKWCTDAEIVFTPTFFVNGYRLPENYSIEELKDIL